MKLSPRARQAALLIALAATLAVTFSIESEPVPEEGKRRARPKATAAQAAERPPANPAQQISGDGKTAAAKPSEADPATAPDAAETSTTDPFRPKSWAPPPPPPPKPKAPSLPFQYLGKVVDGDKQHYFLARQEKYLTVAAGDTIDTNYILERSEPGRLVFLYRPMQERQYLAISAD